MIFCIWVYVLAPLTSPPSLLRLFCSLSSFVGRDSYVCTSLRCSLHCNLERLLTDANVLFDASQQSCNITPYIQLLIDYDFMPIMPISILPMLLPTLFSIWVYGLASGCSLPVLLSTATHCNTLQHTATHCNTLQHTATHCNTLQHTAPSQHCFLHCVVYGYIWVGCNYRVAKIHRMP